MEQNTKLINCPEHNGDCKATLFCYSHKYAGIWECDNTGEGISDTHEHEEYGIEEVTVNYMSNGEPEQYETQIYVCSGVDGCGVEIEGANPLEDKADAQAEARAS